VERNIKLRAGWHLDLPSAVPRTSCNLDDVLNGYLSYKWCPLCKFTLAAHLAITVWKLNLLLVEVLCHLQSICSYALLEQPHQVSDVSGSDKKATATNLLLKVASSARVSWNEQQLSLKANAFQQAESVTRNLTGGLPESHNVAAHYSSAQQLCCFWYCNSFHFLHPRCGIFGCTI
jgi:hypothetical protein